MLAFIAGFIVQFMYFLLFSASFLYINDSYLILSSIFATSIQFNVELLDRSMYLLRMIQPLLKFMKDNSKCCMRYITEVFFLICYNFAQRLYDAHSPVNDTFIQKKEPNLKFTEYQIRIMHGIESLRSDSKVFSYLTWFTIKARKNP